MYIIPFTQYPICLITKIQQRSTIFLATDGSKSDKKPGGAWVLSTTPQGKLLANRSNSDYGSMDNMHSHRSKEYAILSTLLILKEYFNFFSLPLRNIFKRYCANK